VEVTGKLLEVPGKLQEGTDKIQLAWSKFTINPRKKAGFKINLQYLSASNGFKRRSVPKVTNTNH